MINNLKYICLVNGPNLNLLGSRLPQIYGNTSLTELEEKLTKYCFDNHIWLKCFQFNSEGDIISVLHECGFDANCVGIILNPGAYGHYSYSIRDAIEAIDIDVVEIHISNVLKREEFRKNLVLSDVCSKTIYGQGLDGYFLGIDFILNKVN